jgi:hypothetical protein
MIQDIQKLLDDYAAWLKGKTTFRQVDQWVEITTPYLDRHNDYIQIYARKDDGGYTLTDDGYTIGDLEMTGCTLNSPKRRELLNMTLNGFGVRLEAEQRLEVHASPADFALRKHNLMQAILAVNDLFYLAEPVVTRLFFEDVVTWMDRHDIRYTQKAKFTGKTGYDHLFDFVIPGSKSRNQPERFLQVINQPNRDTAQKVAFSWIDTREVRSPDSRAYAILNDSQRKVPAAVLDALRQYDVRPITWSKHNEALEELVA